jgi:hypothetical protein
LRSGKLSPAVECMLWHYAKGKPKDEARTDQHFVISWQDEVTGTLLTARQQLAGKGVEPSRE